MTKVKNFKRGTKVDYEAGEKDGDTLYFVSENGDFDPLSLNHDEEGDIYLGETRLTRENVQSNWTNENTNSPSYIQNRPNVRTGIGTGSIIEGDIESNDSSGEYSHSEGSFSFSDGNYSHAEGYASNSKGVSSHSEGSLTVALGTASHAEGSSETFDATFTKVSGEVNTYTVSGNNALKIYVGNIVTTGVGVVRRVISVSSQVNVSTITLDGELGDGETVQATVLCAANGASAHTEGKSTMTINEAEHAEGKYNKPRTGSHSSDITISTIGIGTSVLLRKNAVDVRLNGDVYIDGIGGYNVDVEPDTLQEVISGIQSDIQIISETQSDWEEEDTTSPSYIQHKPPIKAGIGTDSIEEGSLSTNHSIGTSSHAEGSNRIASGNYSHAEGSGYGFQITISGNQTTYTSSDTGLLEEGYLIVYGDLFATVVSISRTQFSVSSSLGQLTNVIVNVYTDGAIGPNSHVEGWGTIALNKAEHAEGKFNVSHNTKDATISSIGIGTDNDDRLNAVEVLSNGDVYIKGIGLYLGDSLSNASSIQEVISDIYSNIHSYTIASVSPDTGYLTAYQLKQDNTFVGAKINIPKDMVVSNGEVKTVTVADEPYVGAQVGDKYIDLTIANATTDHLYIPVKDLVDVYTEGNGIDISSGNVVSVVVDPNNANGLSVGASGVALATATTSSAGAMSAADKTKLDGIEDGAGVVGTLNTNNSTAQTIESSESFGGSINLHKVSKTGDYDDLNETPIFNEGGNIAIRDLIPYNDYATLDYAKSDSGTYINTGIKPINDDVEFDIRFKITDFSYAYFSLLGDLRSSSDSQNFGLCFFGPLKLSLYNGKSSPITTSNDITTGHVYHVIAALKSGSASLYVVDETAGTSETKTGTYTSATYEYNLNMLWRRYNGDNKMPNVYVYKAVARFRGAAAMNYIPAKRKSDNVAGFLDTVSGNFITGTTGSFTAGNEIDNKEYVISANQQLEFDDILSKPFTSKYTYWAPGAAVTAGWRKLAIGLSYSNYLLIVRGTWSNGRPISAGIAVSCYNTLISLKQLWGTIYSIGEPSKFRLIQNGTNTTVFDLEYYHGAVSSNPGTRYFSFIGLGALTIPDDAHTLVENQEVPSGTNYTQLDIRIMLDRPTVRTNLASTSSAYYDGRNITPGVTGTLPIGNGGTGGSTAKAAEYNLTTNLATKLTTAIGDTYMIPFLATNSSTTNGRFAGYREASLFWNYINGKLSSVLGITAPTAYDGKEIVDELGTTYPFNNHYIDYSGTWISSTTYGHYAIPMEGVRMVRLKANSGYSIFFAFVKNYVYGSPPTSEHASGCWGRESYGKDGEVEVVVPSDAEHLIVYPGAKSTQPYKPLSVKLYGSFVTRTHDGDGYYWKAGPLTADDAIVADWREHNVTNMILTPPSRIVNGYINSSTNKYVSGTYYCSLITMSKNISAIKITAATAPTRIAFLSIDVSSGIVCTYAGGTSSVLVNARETAELYVPSGTKFMYIYLGDLSNGKYSSMPDALYFTGNRGAENFKLRFGNGSYDGSQEVTMPSFTGATSSDDGTTGLVTAPLVADKDKFLKGDGTWATPEGTSYSDFVGSDDGHAGTHGLVPAPVMSGATRLLTSERGMPWQSKDSLDIASKTYVDNMIGDIETLLAAI